MARTRSSTSNKAPRFIGTSRANASRIQKPRTSTGKSRSDIAAFAIALQDVVADAEDDSGLTDLRTIRTATLRSSTLTTCIVCLESLLYDAFPSKRLTSKCRHKPRVCTTCLDTSLQTQFTSKMFDALACPDCNARLSPTDVKNRCPPNILAQYNQIASVWQSCRHARCRGGKLVNTKLEKVMKCVEKKCGKETCISCDEKMHDGKTCKQHIAGKKKMGETKSWKWLGKKTRLCPYHGCGVRIEKDGGCDNMYCTRCSRSFCYRCMGTVDKKLGYVRHERPCTRA